MGRKTVISDQLLVISNSFQMLAKNQKPKTKN
jgi:hypothetical protein